ncbi:MULTISPECIES: nucleoside deaminase [Salegentibacter]|jgi:tRNA(Arg) A34 adenosine deaminase TadA|uniref:tRNA(Arg) A34 adenosine deaminase TadA n=1 Tax=Salegentibacter agarivorans TaxID=345907 RepID=A0A1I2MR52_9FLAO|nr:MULTISPECIES: nucleoside deaminase [Salegentibacter]APS38464.1 guanine deaminase [Salegentibacter sp. T436]SFF93370.1 tRNA(Arg) A34 adenosine deaminase TadA [Salegentibacter agarivorans]|tara:strand:- start:33 stop:509 length:477 start_codon:yes stop_codon:yes gene_type:complete
MKKDHSYFLKRAIQLAEEGMDKGQGGPFGAVIVKDGEIIAEANNKVTASNDPTAHAEVVAIRKACEKLQDFQLENCILYTSCEPCPMCLGAIYWARPKKVYYALTREDAAKIGFDDQFIYDEIALKMDDRKIPFENLMREEGLPIFQKWEAKGDRVDY